MGVRAVLTYAMVLGMLPVHLLVTALLLPFALLRKLALGWRGGAGAGAGDNDHGPLAAVYDFLGNLHSCGMVDRAKAGGAAHFGPGRRVLFAGAGAGQDVALAVALGAEVTALDIAQPMLDQCEKRVARQGGAAGGGSLRCVCLGVQEHREQYDVVVANYFLNVFGPALSCTLLRHLCTLVRPGGVLIIGDFAAPSNPVLKVGQCLHAWPACLLFWALADVHLHLPYDYAAWLPEHMALERRRRFGPFHETCVARRAPA